MSKVFIKTKEHISCLALFTSCKLLLFDVEFSIFAETDNATLFWEYFRSFMDYSNWRAFRCTHAFWGSAPIQFCAALNIH